MSMIEVVTPNLSWLEKVHRPEMIIGDTGVARPFTLPAGELRSLDGKETYVIEHDFAVACGDGADVAVMGTAPGLVVTQPSDVLAWAAQAFFVTQGLGLVRTMTLDALVRLSDLPDPKLTRCPRCRGKLREPGAEMLAGAHATLLPNAETGAAGAGCLSSRVCSRCGGLGRVADFTSGYETITTAVGEITVDRRALTPIVKHLAGDEVALCLAPSLDNLGWDAHLRPYVEKDGKKVVGGAWRVVWSAVPPAPPEEPLVTA